MTFSGHWPASWPDRSRISLSHATPFVQQPSPRQRLTAERRFPRPRWYRPCLYGSCSEDRVKPAPERESESDFVPVIGRSVSIDHAAELLGVSRRTIYNRIRVGRLQTVRTLGEIGRASCRERVSVGVVAQQ